MLCMVHFSAHKLAKEKSAKDNGHTPRVSVHSPDEVRDDEQAEKRRKFLTLQGGIFLAAFVTLIGVLLMGATAFRAVSWSLLIVICNKSVGLPDTPNTWTAFYY